jgi:hypothetical protein
MAKPNVHTASRDELVEAGVRAELAEEILKRRRKGAIRLEALDEVPGVGPATLEQLRQALDFREPQPANSENGNGRGNQQQQDKADERARARETGNGDEPRHHDAPPARIAQDTAAATGSAARLGVKVARDTTAAGTEAAQATGEAARSGLQIVRRGTEAAGEAARRSTASTVQLGQAMAELVQEQTRHNVATLTALGHAVDWERLLRIQSEFLRTTLERTAGLFRRYLEASQAVFGAAAQAGEAGRRDHQRGGGGEDA